MRHAAFLQRPRQRLSFPLASLVVLVLLGSSGTGLAGDLDYVPTAEDLAKRGSWRAVHGLFDAAQWRGDDAWWVGGKARVRVAKPRSHQVLKYQWLAEYLEPRCKALEAALARVLAEGEVEPNSRREFRASLRRVLTEVRSSEGMAVTVDVVLDGGSENWTFTTVPTAEGWRVSGILPPASNPLAYMSGAENESLPSPDQLALISELPRLVLALKALSDVVDNGQTDAAVPLLEEPASSERSGN